MGVEILKFNNIIVDKKAFHKHKEPIDLLSVNRDQVLYLTNLNIITKALSILLVTMMDLLNHYALFYLK